MSSAPQVPRAKTPDRWTLRGKIRRELRWGLRQLAFTVMSVGVLFVFTCLAMWGEAAYKAHQGFSNWIVSTTAADARPPVPRAEEKLNLGDARAIVSEKEAAREALSRHSPKEAPKAEAHVAPRGAPKTALPQDGASAVADPLEALVKPVFRASHGP